MADSAPTASVASTASMSRTSVRTLVLTSGAFLLLQVSATDYGLRDDRGTAAWWFAVGAALLALVYWRRSRVARRVAVVVAVLGVVLYGMNALSEGRAALLALTYLGQVLPLLTPQVRRHVLGR